MRFAIRTKASRLLAAVVMASLTFCANSQSLKPWEFPPALRPTLDARLRLFTQAQSEGRWSEVALLLGRYRRSIGGKVAFTTAHKACLISQMKTSPMTAFDFTVQEAPFSSEILSTPLSSKWWTLTGEAVFGQVPEPVKKQSRVVAYRDRGNWYFTPEPFDDEAWARQHMTPEEIAMDHGPEVKIRVPADSPLSFVDLHVFIDADHIATRRVSFRLQNKTQKTVKGYSFEISDDRRDGSISVGTGAPDSAIQPLGVSRKWEEDDVAYTYWCEGETRMSIELQDVLFADGTSWKARKSQTPSRQGKRIEQVP